MERIATWDDIEQFAQIQKKELDFPVSFAGAEPLFLLDLLGALGEAFDGYDAYTKAADILRDAALAKKDGVDFDAATVAKKIFIDPDQQADDTRYWVAATNAPVAGLGHEANLSAQELSRLADEIRMLIFY